MDFKFYALNSQNNPVRFILNDLVVDYLHLRSNFNESTCTEIIGEVKKRSGKKCALIFGNCQTIFLQRMFLRHMNFSREYFFIQIPAIHLLTENTSRLIFGGGGHIFQICDLIISQQIKDSEFRVAPSSTFIMKFLKYGTKIVWIPNIYFDGYFPQVAKKRISEIEGKIKSEQFPYPDHILDQIMCESKVNPDIDKILDRISSPDFLSREEIQLGIDESLAELKNREWICDVKISDYIEDNFRDKQIFYTTNHPFAFVMFELMRRVLKFIGMRSDNFINRRDLVDEQNQTFSIIGFNIPIYPSVQKFFDFRECEKIYWANMGLSSLRGDFQTFSHEYIKQCWAEKFTR